MGVQKSDILLREYSQAAESCRANERLVRFTYQIYIAFITALGGFLIQQITQSQDVYWLVSMLSVLGALFSIVTVVQAERLTKYYTVYMKRARKIEEKIGMNLYTLGYREVSARRNMVIDIFSFKNLASVIAFVYLVASIVLICRSIEGS